MGEVVSSPAPVQADGTRVGLVADDHVASEDGSDLPSEVLAAFEGVDVILHLGHMGSPGYSGRGVLDRLGDIAPVFAVQDYLATPDGPPKLTPPEGDRVAGLTRVVEVDGYRIGMVHDLGRPPEPLIEHPRGEYPRLGALDIASLVTAKFGQAVDVVAFGGSHRAGVVLAQGVLFVNPGSPTYARGPGRAGGRLGSVGILEIGDGMATFELVELEGVRELAAADT